MRLFIYLSSCENHAVFLEEAGLKSLFRVAKSLDPECGYLPPYVPGNWHRMSNHIMVLLVPLFF